MLFFFWLVLVVMVLMPSPFVGVEFLLKPGKVERGGFQSEVVAYSYYGGP